MNSWLDAPRDLRLVIADMDGTLLDEHKHIPADFWPLLDVMRERGIVFCPASGRQYATLAQMFDSHLAGMPVVAENGSIVMRDGEALHSTPLDPAVAAETVRRVRAAVAATPRDAGIVVCGRRGAYVDRADEAFWNEADRYYKALDLVANVLPVAALEAVDDEILKVAVFDFEDASAVVAPALDPLGADGRAQVVVSGQNWVDVMDPRVSKGTAVELLQADLGVTPAQTVVFGDYLNDLEMMRLAHWSFAMENSHPAVLAAARYTAPSHKENGVVRTLAELLG